MLRYAHLDRMFSLQMNMTGKLKLLVILLAAAFGEGMPVSRKLKRPYEQKERAWNWDNDDDCLKDKTHRTFNSGTEDHDELTDITREQMKEALHSSAELYNSELDFEHDEIVVNIEIRLRVRKNDYYFNAVGGVDKFTDFNKILDNYHDIYDDYKLSLSAFADDNDDDDDGEIYDDDDDDDDDDEYDFMDDEICEGDNQFDDEICDDDDDDDDDNDDDEVEVDENGDHDDGSQTNEPAMMFDADNFDIENDSDKPVLFQSFWF